MKIFPLWLLGILACLGLAGTPSEALAQRTRVVLLPAHTFKGSAANSPIVTGAFRENLEDAGYEIVAGTATEAVLEKLSIDLSRPQFIQQLRAVGRELNARYVFYPRVLGVGIPPNRETQDTLQATIILNVANPDARTLLHTRQIGQVFKSPERRLEAAIINKDAAAEAAQRLLEGFYKKYRK
jgi:hypothetical protein